MFSVSVEKRNNLKRQMCVGLQWTRVNCDVARNKTIRKYFMFSGPEVKW
jgi:hypothetical protein